MNNMKEVQAQYIEKELYIHVDAARHDDCNPGTSADLTSEWPFLDSAPATRHLERITSCAENTFAPLPFRIMLLLVLHIILAPPSGYHSGLVWSCNKLPRVYQKVTHYDITYYLSFVSKTKY